MRLPAGENSLSEADYARFRELMHQKSGLDFPEPRRLELERAVLHTLVETTLPDTETLYRLLTAGDDGQVVLEALIDRLTVDETYFFRNRPQFEVLERQVLPDLIARRREARRLRLWCAGCASGEEPHSLAMLLERLLPDLDQWNVLLLATDISRQRLEKARRGVYRPWSFRGVPPEIQATYFIPRGPEFEVVPNLRRLVAFAYLNLVEDVYPSLLTNTQAMDLILCRNVLMYFRRETAARVVGRLYDCLAEGGYLVVGHAEPSRDLFHRFAARTFPGTVLYQRVSEGMGTGPTSAAPQPTAPEPPTRGRTVLDAPDAGLHRIRQARAGEETVGIPASAYEEAIALSETGKDDEALRRLETLAASNHQDSRAPYLAAKICASRLQLKAAEGWIEIALQRAPLLAPAHYLHGLVLQEEGELEAALAALRRCVYADPEFVLGYIALAGLFRRLGHPRRAQKALDTAAVLLAERRCDDPVPDAEGLTAGWLLELVTLQRES